MEKPYFEVEVMSQREELVKKLNGICNQLLKWGLSHNPGNISRCKFFRAAIYACSVQLQALRDVELDALRKDVELLKEKVGIEHDKHSFH